MTDEPAPSHDAAGDAPEPAGASWREAHASLREFVDAIPHVVFLIDREYRIREVSAGAVLPREAALGLNAADFLAPEERAGVLGAWDRALLHGETSVYETTGLGPDGARTHFVARVGPLRRGEQIAGAVVSAMDITERKRLDETARAATARAEAAAAELAEKNREILREIESRAEAERALVAQREALRALSTPILKLWDGVLALPVIGFVDSARAAQMMERLLEEIVATGACFAILDITGVEVVDTATASYLLSLVRAAGLLGSRCLVSGISPTVAQTMVHLEVGLQELKTFGTLQAALRFAIAASAPTART